MGKIRHPFQRCAVPYCCFCFDFGCNVTCYMVAILCIVVNAFMWTANFGIGHVSLYIISLLTFSIYLIAGILLLLGAFWGKDKLKEAYCWLCLVGMTSAVIGLILTLVFRKSSYLIWGRGCHILFKGSDIVLIALHVVWLLLWSIYTPMIVLGNKSCDDT